MLEEHALIPAKFVQMRFDIFAAQLVLFLKSFPFSREACKRQRRRSPDPVDATDIKESHTVSVGQEMVEQRHVLIGPEPRVEAPDLPERRQVDYGTGTGVEEITQERECGKLLAGRKKEEVLFMLVYLFYGVTRPVQRLEINLGDPETRTDGDRVTQLAYEIGIVDDIITADIETVLAGRRRESTRMVARDAHIIFIQKKGASIELTRVHLYPRDKIFPCAVLGGIVAQDKFDVFPVPERNYARKRFWQG